MSDNNREALYEPLPEDLQKALEKAEEEYLDYQWKLAVQRMWNNTAPLVARIKEDQDTNS